LAVAVCVEILQAPFELSAACGPISPCCRIHTPPKPLFFSLVRRMIAMLINHVAEKTNASAIYSVAFSPDGTKIVSGLYDKTIKVWDSGAPEFSTSNLLGQN
jgi:WD40 repeat protein